MWNMESISVCTGKVGGSEFCLYLVKGLYIKGFFSS